jgi:hypothetical protein
VETLPVLLQQPDDYCTKVSLARSNRRGFISHLCRIRLLLGFEMLSRRFIRAEDCLQSELLKLIKLRRPVILKISNTVSLTTPFSSMLFLQSTSAPSCLCGLTAAMTSTILSAMLSTSSTLLTPRFSRFILPQEFSQFSSTGLEGIISLLLCTKQGRITDFRMI